MSTSHRLRILSLEDDPNDTELIHATLEAEGIDCEVARVDTETAFHTSLEKGEIDLILADYKLPSFDGLSALKLAASICPEVPFLFVSGTLGEEVAIEALKVGATDYVLKTRLSRLAPSVRRALREASGRAERRQAEKALSRSEAFLAEAQRLSRTGSFGWSVPTREVFWSAETYRVFGCSPEATPTVELVLERTHPDDRQRLQQVFEHASVHGGDFDIEHRLVMDDGSIKYLRVVARIVRGDAPDDLQVVGAVTDVTEAKRAEEARRRSEGYLEDAQRLTRTGSWAYDVAVGRGIHWSQENFRLLGFDPEQGVPPHDKFLQRIHPEDRANYSRAFDKAITHRQSNLDLEYRVVLPDGETRYVHSIGHPVFDKSGNFCQYVGTAMDVTEQHNARAALETAFQEIQTLKDQLYKENIALREEIVQTSMFEEIVGESPALQAVLVRVTKVAPTDSTVLITGETGTGKELIARAIHKRSQRTARAFVSVNCAAIPTSLISSELFGHEKGAFTGATQRRLGRFELAEGGTLFLDEVGELPPETQTTLLRVLQEREFERVGGTKVISANVRVIVATNRDLQASIDAGTFRDDLYYRFNVFPIEMPSLRQRREDIPLLVEYFIARYSAKTGKKIRSIEKSTLDRLRLYAWPGNIRELQNVVERSVILCESETFTVDESWLSGGVDQPDRAGQTLLKIPPSQEKKAIEDALAEAQGRVSGPSGAAARLGVPPSTLDSKIKTLNINKHRFFKTN
ncbi:sigma 54-interacting transcriptional regulator [Tunturibacter empetritectus]|uniref:PAS domain S-box-containing protein n=1 Tax=Tunturiibacter empetritectus TaxID=3069691 RepID=A0A7W8MQS8_9BACT|nr:sigma 54-interacting transcriptional regulator [Edaphobacter lichenicola]MBB5317066.1 PAS domain S-box-containing protein [Edaphobacter lichenicola]